MKIGIVGFPNVGKSTLFNAITKAGAECANYPFCTIEPNVGVVAVPDDRLSRIAEIEKPDKVTPTSIEFVDIAGLVKGASKGEGLGNKFLSHLREVDALLHVVRAFDDQDIVHVDGDVNPIRDIEVLNLELIFADLESVDRRIDRVTRQAKSQEKKYLQELKVLKRVKDTLEKNLPARTLDLCPQDRYFMEQLALLTLKPLIYVANVSENDLTSPDDIPYIRDIKAYSTKENTKTIVICAQLEAELAELDEDERRELLEVYGLNQPGLDLLIKASYRLLGLITYFTLESKEVRAWTIIKGTKAPQAAGKIHTDFEKGFIRAEVMDYEVLDSYGSQHTVREKGLLRSEGKDYVVKDGDVILFRFNV